MTIAEACDHFVQGELTKDNSWRSYSTKKLYKAYLYREVISHWRSVRLSEVKNDRSRVMASQFAPGEEQLCENPRYSLGSFQLCLPS
jgi:hypothetical protein